VFVVQQSLLNINVSPEPHLTEKFAKAVVGKH
jgi:hypothetical protein